MNISKDNLIGEINKALSDFHSNDDLKGEISMLYQSLNITGKKPDKEIKVIDKEIQKTLFIEEDTYGFMQAVEHFRLLYFIDKSTKNDFNFNFIEYIRSLMCAQEGCRTNSRAWLSALFLYTAKQSLRSFKTTDFIENGYDKYKNAAEAYHHLKEKGYSLTVINGTVALDEDEQKRISNEIDRKLKRLGSSAVRSVLVNIQDYYNDDFGQYFFPKSESKAQIPWGYLLKCSLKHFNKADKLKNSEALWKEALLLAQSYCTLLGVNEYSKFDLISTRVENVAKKIQDAVIFDQVYSISQWNVDDTLQILEYYVAEIGENESIFPWAPKDYLEVCKKLNEINHKNSNNGNFTFDVLIKELLVDKRAAYTILNDLSVSIHQLNNNYTTPFDAQYSNYYAKPIIKINQSKFVFLDKCLFCYGILEVFFKISMVE